MNISIIFTGGTIGSRTKSQWMGIDESANYLLLEKFPQTDGLRFQVSSPYSILSENLSARELNALQEEIARQLLQKPDGIIVTHGTDTLQYSAAAVEFAFADAPVPIVFVSAAHPLDNPLTNGYDNFEAAVALIRSGAGGVFVSYRNGNESFVRLHTASRLLTHEEGSADLFSMGDREYARYADGAIIPGQPLPAREIHALGPVRYRESSGILSVESRPGDLFAYSLERVKAVILKPYHSATLNTASPALTAFCKAAEERGIPVFVSGVRAGLSYESTGLFDALGLRIPPFSTYVSLYMKLWAALSLDRDPAAFLQAPIAGELAE